MDIQFYGANCVSLGIKQARIVIDDNLADLGAKSVSKEGDILVFTGEHPAIGQKAKLVIDQPGEYEVAGVFVYGIAARSHIDNEGFQTATMYKFVVDDLSVLVTGHVSPDLNDDQLEAIGMVDVVIVPVGGNGYTVDGLGALKLLKKVEPKLVIPTYYSDPKLDMPVPAQTLEQALTSLAMEPKETIAKLRLKPAELTDVMQLVVLEKS